MNGFLSIAVCSPADLSYFRLHVSNLLNLLTFQSFFSDGADTVFVLQSLKVFIRSYSLCKRRGSISGAPCYISFEIYWKHYQMFGFCHKSRPTNNVIFSSSLKAVEGLIYFSYLLFSSIFFFPAYKPFPICILNCPRQHWRNNLAKVTELN